MTKLKDYKTLYNKAADQQIPLQLLEKSIRNFPRKIPRNYF